MKSDVDCKAYVNPASRMIDIWLWTKDGEFYGKRGEGDNYEFHGITFMPTSPGERDSGPAFRLTPEDAQILMNSLWECGLRPLAAAGSAGQLDATRAHLADMRLIALTKLGIKT